MVNHLTVEQVEMIKEHCSQCSECVIHTMFTYSYQYCNKYRTDSLVFLAERCDAVQRLLELDNQDES